MGTTQRFQKGWSGPSSSRPPGLKTGPATGAPLATGVERRPPPLPRLVTPPPIPQWVLLLRRLWHEGDQRVAGGLRGWSTPASPDHHPRFPTSTTGGEVQEGGIAIHSLIHSTATAGAQSDGLIKPAALEDTEQGRIGAVTAAAAVAYTSPFPLQKLVGVKVPINPRVRRSGPEILEGHLDFWGALQCGHPPAAVPRCTRGGGCQAFCEHL